MYKFATRIFHGSGASTDTVVTTSSIRVTGIDVHSNAATINLLKFKDNDDNVLLEILLVGQSTHYHITLPWVADNGLKYIVEDVVSTPSNVDVRIFHFSEGG